MILESGPGGSPAGRIGGFVVATVDPQILLAECRVHEIAMMRPCRIGMSVRAEVPAADAHALDWNGSVLLKLADDGHELDEQSFLLFSAERGDRLPERTGGFIAGPERGLARIGDDNAHGAAICRIGELFDKRLALECKEGVGDGRLRHANP